MRKVIASVLAASIVALAGCSTAKETTPKTGEQTPAKPVELSFYFPVAVGGAAANALEAMVKEFNTANPNIKVTGNFSGNYTDTMTKVQASIQGGAPVDSAILLATDVYTLLDQKAIVAVDELAKADKDGAEYLGDFLPALMLNSKVDGKLWSVPFQRSVPVLFWNKETFTKNGLKDAPKNWDELVSSAKTLTKDGNWGVEIPSDGNPSWIFSSFSIQAGKSVVNENGTEVYLNTPENEKGIQFILDLAKTNKVMPAGVIKWGDAPNDFIAGKTAMIYHTTGSIGLLKSKMDPAKIGVAPMPAGVKPGAPTGGGNLYVFKTTPEKQAAAWKFVRFMTEPERVAQWSVTTGYIAASNKAWATKTMKDAVAAFPGYAVAKDALANADRELATHNNQQILKAYGDELQAIVNGTKDVKTALKTAQENATKILAPFKK
ncbi:MAG TPA: ABC transporter substrate-binding protein [Symbiobacteriaceae bacterium]|nr:ABC transporter substrate-binding protein [Symbiobacteriaceae bacterium]